MVERLDDGVKRLELASDAELSAVLGRLISRFQITVWYDEVKSREIEISKP